MDMKYSFDAKFEGNILVVGRTGCGKTTIVQNLGKNKIFREIKEVIWISKIVLFKDRGDNISNCFVNEHIDFKYPDSIEDFDDLLEVCRRKRAPYRKTYLEENTKLHTLIVIDNVLGLADRSEAFDNFLTVLRKFGLSCVYIFHRIYLTRQN